MPYFNPRPTPSWEQTKILNKNQSCFKPQGLNHKYPPLELDGLTASYVYISVPEEAQHYFHYSRYQTILAKETGKFWSVPVFKIDLGEYRRHSKLLRAFPISVDMNDQHTLFRFRYAVRDKQYLNCVKAWIKDARVVLDEDDPDYCHWEFTFTYRITYLNKQNHFYDTKKEEGNKPRGKGEDD